MSAQVCIDVVAAAARRAAMPKRKADECISNTRGKSSTRVSLDDERRKKLRAELVASTGVTKSGIAKVLQTLQGEGLLKDDKLGAPKERDRLTEASAHHARAHTPYGKVVQRVAIPMTTGPPLAWEFINPFAFIWYLSTICCEFSEMMANAARNAGHKLRFLLYGDELTPGNPLRVDGGRQSFCFYYSFLDWPPWILHRKDGWLALGALRTSIIHRIDGGVSHLITIIMKTLFVDGPVNFADGFSFMNRGVSVLCTATFVGFIADEKGLKEFLNIKGQAGHKPCPNCKNVVNFIHKRGAAGSDYVVGLDATSLGELKLHNDKSFFAMVSRVGAAAAASNAECEELEKVCGVNYDPRSILFCPELRPLIKMPDIYHRDWQHTLCSNGVAGTEIAAILGVMQANAALKARNIVLDTLEKYCAKFTMPSEHSSNKNWFSKKHIAPDHVKHFASDILCMVPLLYSFFTRVVAPLGHMADNITCFGLLYKILSILQCTYVLTAEKYAELRRAVDEHHQLFKRLYPNHIKVKFHHLLHLPEDLQHLGLVLSCFVTERKHRDWKRTSIWAFRHVEHQSTFDFVNYCVQEFVSGRFSFKPVYLVNPEQLVDVWSVSWTAITLAGCVRRGDVVVVISREGEHRVGECLRFWQRDDDSFIEVLCYRRISKVLGEYSTDTSNVGFFRASSVKVRCAHAPSRKNVVHVIVPFCL